MRLLGFNRYALSVSMAATILAACGGSQPPVSPFDASTQNVSPGTQARHGRHLPPPDGRDLYVANIDSDSFAGSVSIYAPGTTTPAQTITEGVNDPTSLAFDAEANLYVSNYNASTVTVYAPGADKPLRTISNGINGPVQVAVAGLDSDNVYVANTEGAPSVTVYKAGTTLLQTIVKGINIPRAITFDSKGRLFVVQEGESKVTVYSAGKNQLLRAIHNGIDGPAAAAFDGSGNLYVANGGSSTVAVYAPGSSKVSRTIRDGVAGPSALAFDRSGNLYVANTGNNTVTVYAPGSSTVSQTISQGVRGPYGLTSLGSYNYLNVANFSGGSVTEYAPGSGTVARTITDGIAGPVWVAFPPCVSCL